MGIMGVVVATILDGLSWLLLAVGTAAVTLAAEAKDTADWLRR